MSFRKTLISSFSIALSAMISATAMGDDLEIYFGSSSEQVTYNPNVMFIMDTSGSMAGKDGTEQSRILRVQNALKETLNSVTNINAGLMRFSDYGGPVLYPIRPIDDPVAPELILPVSNPSDDAHEIDGIMRLDGNHMVLSQGTSIVKSGLRYQSVNIPRGAVITNAFIRFTSQLSNTSATDLRIKGELIGDAPTFGSGANDISDRTTTGNEVLWSTDNGFPTGGETIASSPITSVIQEIVDQASWCGGNALNLIIEGTSASTASARQAKTFEDGNGLSPQLVVTYDETTANGCVRGEVNYQVSSQDNNAEEKNDGNESTGTELTLSPYSNAFIGLRFESIAVPQNVTITNAYLRFTANRNRSDAGTSLNISAADEANPDNFKYYTKNVLRNKPKTTSVPWTNIPSFEKNVTYNSPSISSVVQQIVNRGDWVPGNNMVIILSDFVGRRGAYTFQGKPSGAAQLVIEYEGNAVPGTVATVREHLISKVDELNAAGLTPIVDTLLEASNYYGGLSVDYGLTRGAGTNNTVKRNTRVSHRLSYLGANSVLPTGCNITNLSADACKTEQIPAGATYISPIEDQQCQTNNHIVLLSDGVANNNHSADKIKNALGITNCSGSSGELCGVELAKNIGKTGESYIDGRIVTHTIGFAANAVANNFLNKLALNGGGGFYEADNSADLVTAFQSILKTVKDVNATFVSPGVAVNQLNRLTHNDELYFALFKPAEGTIWPGNVKKYKIDGDKILDRNGLNAIDEGTGFFKENAHSYWSTLADGNDVREGGAAAQLDLTRNMYYFDAPGSIINTAQKVHETNTNITTSDLALNALIDKEVVRETLLKWTRGVDVRDDDADGETDDVRMQMGDPIHSQPVIVNYSTTDSAIFVSTNQGFLHSIDPETGSENFAIIPKDLLNNLYDLYQDGSTFSHIYGLDGDMVLRNVDDTTKYLYVGMRRGGKNYYAFDISNKMSPRLVFKIESGTPGFEKLGQSWSRPTITKMRFGGSAKNVMIFGGGYDEDQDNNLLRTTDNEGNAVYIVDADTGALLWSASNSDADLIVPEMEYSIPARISVIDREGDGFADHLYVVDMGGQIFRLDVKPNGPGGPIVGGLLADFGGPAEEDNRRFFYGPDVSEISLGDDHYYAVAIGSGYRAHPLDTKIQDHFYMIKDYGVFGLDEDGNYGIPSPAFTISDMYDATTHLLTSSDEGQRDIEAALFADSAGWLIKLGTGGEKVLASPLIINYQLFFTTYLPSSASTSSCAPPTGNSRAYLVELVNGNAIADLDNNGTQEHEDRYAQLKQTGIAPETKILIEDIIKPVVCLGTECTSAVIDVDENGNAKACGTQFECLAQNIYGRFERVRKSAWKTEIERD